MILLDSSVLVEHFRSKDKQATFFYQLASNKSDFSISAVTKYEILIGSKDTTNKFWKDFFNSLQSIPFDDIVVEKAVEVYKNLKSVNKMIPLADLLIAATALAYQILVATLNIKHFERIQDLQIIKKS